YGTNGVARFRLHGGTHPTAVALTPAGQALVASGVPWGWVTSAGTCFQPCVSRLDANGNLDLTFGSAGMCRHDGLGSAEIVAVGPTGRVWTAGIAELFVSPNFVKVLSVSQSNPDGELESGFGLNG